MEVPAPSHGHFWTFALTQEEARDLPEQQRSWVQLGIELLKEDRHNVVFSNAEKNRIIISLKTPLNKTERPTSVKGLPLIRGGITHNRTVRRVEGFLSGKLRVTPNSIHMDIYTSLIRYELLAPNGYRWGKDVIRRHMKVLHYLQKCSQGESPYEPDRLRNMLPPFPDPQSPRRPRMEAADANGAGIDAESSSSDDENMIEARSADNDAESLSSDGKVPRQSFAEYTPDDELELQQTPADELYEILKVELTGHQSTPKIKGEQEEEPKGLTKPKDHLADAAKRSSGSGSNAESNKRKSVHEDQMERPNLAKPHKQDESGIDELLNKIAASIAKLQAEEDKNRVTTKLTIKWIMIYLQKMQCSQVSSSVESFLATCTDFVEVHVWPSQEAWEVKLEALVHQGVRFLALNGKAEPVSAILQTSSTSGQNTAADDTPLEQDMDIRMDSHLYSPSPEQTTNGLTPIPETPPVFFRGFNLDQNPIIDQSSLRGFEPQSWQQHPRRMDDDRAPGGVDSGTYHEVRHLVSKCIEDMDGRGRLNLMLRIHTASWRACGVPMRKVLTIWHSLLELMEGPYPEPRHAYDRIKTIISIQRPGDLSPSFLDLGSTVHIRRYKEGVSALSRLDNDAENEALMMAPMFVALQKGETIQTLRELFNKRVSAEELLEVRDVDNWSRGSEARQPSLTQLSIMIWVAGGVDPSEIFNTWAAGHLIRL